MAGPAPVPGSGQQSSTLQLGATSGTDWTTMYWDLAAEMLREHGPLLTSAVQRLRQNPNDPTAQRYRPYAQLYMKVCVCVPSPHVLQYCMGIDTWCKLEWTTLFLSPALPAVMSGLSEWHCMRTVCLQPTDLAQLQTRRQPHA